MCPRNAPTSSTSSGVEALYHGQQGADAVQLEEVQRARLPRAVSAACSPGSGLLACLFLATTQDGMQKYTHILGDCIDTR